MGYMEIGRMVVLSRETVTIFTVTLTLFLSWSFLCMRGDCIVLLRERGWGGGGSCSVLFFGSCLPIGLTAERLFSDCSCDAWWYAWWWWGTGDAFCSP